MSKLTNVQLEATMTSYRDLLKIPVRECGEPFVFVNSKSIINGYLSAMNDMKTYFEGQIPVRRTVFAKLKKAQAILGQNNPSFSLCVTYGYRSEEIQTKKFGEQLAVISKNKFFADPLNLYEEVHRFIAVPTVAGHPTGGAVDVTIIDNQSGNGVDFGSRQYDFSTKDCYVYAPSITREARNNRFLLRNCLTQVGFAPFDGEWWHFSYGDQEWAYYYQRPSAIYEQQSVETVGSLLKD